MKRMQARMLLCCCIGLFLYSTIGEGSSFSSPLLTETDFQAHFNLGIEQKSKSEFKKAKESFQKALDIARKNKDGKNESETLIQMALLQWIQGEFAQSDERLKEASSVAERLDLKGLKERVLAFMTINQLYKEGKQFNSDDQFDDSIQKLEEAVAEAKRIHSPDHEMRCLRVLSLPYWRKEDLGKFHSLNQAALKIARELNNKTDEGRCLFNIGLYYSEVEDYSQALRHYEEALTLARELNNINDEALCLNNISEIYIFLGNYDRALKFMDNVLKIDRQLQDFAYVAMDLNNIGVTHRKMGLISKKTEDFKKAKDSLLECLELSKKNNYTETEINALNNLGTVFLDLKDYSSSLNYFNQALEKAKKTENKKEVSNILINIGVAHVEQEDHQGAVGFLQEAINLSSEQEMANILWEAHYEIGNAYLRQKNYEKALYSYKKAITLIEDIRSRINLEELKASYLGSDKRIEPYHGVVDVFCKLSHSDPERNFFSEAFSYVERSKARAFLDSLNVAQINLSQGVDKKLLNQEESLMKEISNLNLKLLIPDLKQTEADDINYQISAKEQGLESVRRQIRMSSPAFANIRDPQIISLQEAQALLPDNQTAFFEYSLGKTQSYAFVISKNNLKAITLPRYQEIQKMVKDYLQIISDKDTANFQLGHTLFETLVLAGLNDQIKNLIISPDGILHYLPFEALNTCPEENPSWLIQSFKISYVPSITVYREILQQERGPSKPHLNVLAFGDPYFGPQEEQSPTELLKNFTLASVSNLYRLKHSGEEVDRISSIFKNKKVDIYKRQEATEDRLKKLNLETYKIIHFATHGLINDKLPDRSSIALSMTESSMEDGFLQMREIFNLKLNSDLVTLSACQTGLGRFIRGEGLVGLSRAFFYAGASTTLISLWPVHDQTSSQLMGRFYEYLHSSHSINDAIQNTKLEMINSGVLSHPYYWASFIVSGNADRVIYPSRLGTILIMGLMAVVILVLSVLIIRKRKRLAR